ncbi:MAG: hypothetical protein AAF242_02615, partial [Bacteroidota bacterium]
MITTTSTYPNAAIGDYLGVFEEIHNQEKNIAIYQRNIDALQAELSQLAGQDIEYRASGTLAVIVTDRGWFRNRLDFIGDRVF